MRSKFLLVALAAFLVNQSLIQVASAVVGYVNVTLTPGYKFINNPLSWPPNTVSNNINYLPNGVRVYVWDVTNQVFHPPAVYDKENSRWSTNYDIPVGRGFVVYSPVPWTNTFIGEVLQGPLTNFVAGSNKWSLLGSKVPQAGAISDLGFPRLDGANVHFFRSANQTFSSAYTCFDNEGWFDFKGSAVPSGPACAVAESFFVQNPRTETNWFRFFIVPRPEQARLDRTATTEQPKISSISVKGTKVTLSIERRNGTYDVQHSTDGVTWTTLAENRSGAVWVGDLPHGAMGYFQVISASVKEAK